MIAAWRIAEGHVFTIAPMYVEKLCPTLLAEADAWALSIDDPRVGAVRLNGLLSRGQRKGTLLVVVHGLGGSAKSHYTVGAAAAAERAGVPCFRFNLRGADA